MAGQTQHILILSQDCINKFLWGLGAIGMELFLHLIPKQQRKNIGREHSPLFTGYAYSRCLESGWYEVYGGCSNCCAMIKFKSDASINI